MAEKRLYGRAVQKHDIQSNWDKTTNFIPMAGELIIYDIDENYNYERFKIGDGKTDVKLLPFADANKVDKISGKGLSTNDYTTEEKNKLAGIAAGANKTIVDESLSSTSTNPVQNKVINDAIVNISSLVGDTSVSSQISTAIANKVDKIDGKGLSANDYTTAEKTKLFGISEGAEVNQNAFSNVVVGSTTIAAGADADTITLSSGANITMTPDTTGKKITIAATDSTYTTVTTTKHGLMTWPDKVKLDGIEAGANKTTVDSALSATSTNPVQNKIINSALAGKAASSHPHDVATTSTNGFMSAADKTALDNVVGLVGDTSVTEQITGAVASKADIDHIQNIENGGTSATTAEGALKNLGLVTLNGGGIVGAGVQTETGGAVGKSAYSEYGFAGGTGAYSKSGGAAAGRNAISGSGFAGGSSTFVGTKDADGTITSYGGGGAVGSSAATTSGGAVGYGAKSGNGGAVGYGAFVGIKADDGTVNTSSGTGGAVGQNAQSKSGGAVGFNAISIDGFAGGNGAKAIANGAVQLGVGTNEVANTLKFINHKISNGSGTLYGTVQSSGADTAEQFEWADSNANNEDRRGYFVTVDTGEMIRIANSSDDYILGVISSKDISSFISNTAYDGWHDKYLRDVYGDYILEEKLIPEEKDETTGEIIVPEHTDIVRSINPEYDENREYIPRMDRPEWAVVCFMGQIVVNDDGTCKVNEYCKVSDNGGATAAEKTDPIKYRVIKRIDDTHVKIIFK